MAADKLDRRLLERLAAAEAQGGEERAIAVVLHCLGADSEEPSAPGDQAASTEDSTLLAFHRLLARLSELGASGDVRMVPVSNAIEARLTPAQIRAVASHPAVGRIMLSRDTAQEQDRAASVSPGVRRPGVPWRGPDEMLGELSKRIIGQAAALRAIVPYVLMYEAGLAPTGRPVGVFLLLGPTGTGKTRTVEALAEALHGSDQQLLRVDCSEYQEDHEIAKLIGAPPGYIGHRDTPPFFTAQRLSRVTSEASDLSIVLFDEIEKAAPALSRLLLGVLDRATLTLGDGNKVNFERSLIFMTSNLGAQDMVKELAPGYGFAPALPDRAATSGRLEAIALASVRKAFSPEFVNRIDAVVTYEPLSEQALDAILVQQVAQLREHIHARMGPAAFTLEVPDDSRRLLLRRGTSAAYGARELRRTVHRHLTQPLAALVAARKIEPGARVRAVPAADGESLEFRAEAPATAVASSHRILVVDDNRPLLDLMRDVLSRAGWEVATLETAAATRAAAEADPPRVAVVDYLLPDDSGLDLAMDLKRRYPECRIIVMSGVGLPADDEAACREAGFLTLPKPFQVPELLAVIQRATTPHAATTE